MTVHIPNMATLANAKDRLEQANFKIGKAQTAAIMSTAVARQDVQRLKDITLERDAADADYRKLVAALTEGAGHTAAQAATEVRDRADPEIQKIASETPAPKPSLADLFGGGSSGGGPVEAGETYLVGERGAESFVPHTRILNAQPGDQEIPSVERTDFVNELVEGQPVDGFRTFSKAADLDPS